MHRFFSQLLVICLGIAVLSPAHGQVLISEFMASNGATLADEDGDYQDWIELYNSGETNIDLNGWYLSDDASDLTKWRIPAVTIPAKGFLIVFASGKDRAIASLPLHTSFSLGADGEYLALVRPGGSTVASAFAPAFPEQFRDISYGIGQAVTTNVFLSETASARAHVPTSAALGNTWIQPAFNHNSWLNGPLGAGFETEAPGFAVHNYKASIFVESLLAADGVIANPAQQVGVVSETAPIINYFNSGSEAHYDNNRTFPGQTINVDIEDFVIEATATITFPSAGPWTFGVNSDDGFRLVIGSFQVEFPNPRGPEDTLGTFNVPAAGDYPLRLVFYERGGGAGLELFAASGSRAIWDATNFRLVGDTANGGLAVRSVPVAGGGGGSLTEFIGTDIETQMRSVNSSAYVRVPFNVTNPANLESLTLRIRYNDGFVAYLNGQEIARRNAPANPQWNSVATAARPSHESGILEDINISDRLGHLVAGANLLAIQGLNLSAADGNFLIQPQLVEYQVLSQTNLYFTAPSPGALNGDGVLGFTTTPDFSVDHGFYDAPFDLELTTPTPGATIMYTTNGSPPALDNGFIYSAPLRISGTTTLTAATFMNQFERSPASTRTYLFVEDIIRQSPTGQAPPGWPSNWGANVVDYGMDPDVVNSPNYAPTIEEDLKALPSFSIVMNLADLFDPASGIYANPGQDGPNWERPCSVELIHPDGTDGFQIPAGIRIRGGFSRSTDNPKHAFRLFFRGEYGASKLEYPLFGDNGTDSFDKIDLRTFQNYSWSFQGDGNGIFVRDQLNRDLQLAMGHQGERGEFYHLYINGQYWGVFNTCERPEAAFGETYYGGQRENYDVVKVEAGPYAVNATDGNMDAWTRLYQLAQAGFASDAAYQFVQGNNPDGSPNPAYENLVDVPNLIDYMLVILYGGNLDAPISNFLGNTRPNNFYGMRDRTGPFGFRFFVHDAEHTLLNVNENRMGPYPAGDSSVLYSSPQWVWQKLQANPEFRLRVADHVHRHFFNNGVLTSTRARELFLARTTQLNRAVVGESARWGDSKRGTPFTRVDWQNAVNNVLNNYIPQRSAIVLAQLRNGGLYPTVAAPSFNQHGGNVQPGFGLTMSAPAGTIYYTLDGSDPRLSGGSVSPAARVYSTSVALAESTAVNARVRNGSTWSALNTASFTLIQTFTDLFITEIMYNPPATETNSGTQLEFIELKNVGSIELDLSGVQFTDGVQFTFPIGTRLDPGAFVVLVSDAAAFGQAYPGVTIDDVYTGQLANSGEQLTLSHAVGTPIFSVNYSDLEPWPTSPDGAGFSLVPLNPNLNADPDVASNWRASSLLGGSPGADDGSASIPTIRINEILTHTDLPDVDTIELHNPNPFPVDVGHWYLTDRRTTPKKFRIPSPATIPAGGFMTFEETDFNPDPGVDPSFTLSSHGEEVYIYSGDAAGNLTGYSHGFTFPAAANGVTFGRYVTSTGDPQYPAQAAVTLGASNSGPRVGPVVIDEIHYQPPVGDAEFIELRNITASPVSLYNVEHPDLPWRVNGIDFSFPPGTQIAANGLMLIVSGDPAAFRAKHGVPAEVPIFGPFLGGLQDGGERIQLLRPDNPDVDDNGQPIIPEIVVDEVRYDNALPWPSEAAGTGSSLERLNASAYGDDPINWRASPGGPSAGLPNTGNRPPQVDPGADQTIASALFPVTISLNGSATDDGMPGPLTVAWSQISGPGTAWFESATSLATTASLPGVGSYVLRLTAHDGALQASGDLIVNLGRSTSAAVFISQGATWKYSATGTDLPANWTTAAYNDAAWPSGAAKLGYGDGDEVTTIGYGPDPNNKYLTTFFRRTFQVANAATVQDLKAGLRRDDGAVVYLNGTEILRSNMPEGSITFSTTASSALGGTDETTFFEHPVDPALLVNGANILAVRIHQFNGPSSDLGFDLYLTGTAFPLNTAPEVSAGPDQTIAPTDLALLDGEIEDDGLPIPPGLLSIAWTRINGPGTVAFANANAAQTTASFTAPGSYTLRLSANDGALTGSDDIVVQVTGDGYQDWRAAHFTAAELLNPAISGDDADPDQDDHTNYQEYLADTDPRDSDSVLRIVELNSVPASPMALELRFHAVAGRSYSIQSRATATGSPWTTRTTIPEQPNTGFTTATINDAIDAAPRFYRIVTPQQP